MSAKFPRQIRPSLIEQGDLITVTYVKKDGIELSAKGRVSEILNLGPTRLAVTREGGRLCTWGSEDGRGLGYTVTLHARQPAEQVAMFDLV